MSVHLSVYFCVSFAFYSYFLIVHWLLHCLHINNYYLLGAWTEHYRCTQANNVCMFIKLNTKLVGSYLSYNISAREYRLNIRGDVTESSTRTTVRPYTCCWELGLKVIHNFTAFIGLCFQGHSSWIGFKKNVFG